MDEDKRDYLELGEIKSYLLDIMTSIDNFCIDNGLRYYLAWGSLLGAVRHEGFIPWDDDIDIWMPRPDYDRFVKVYSDGIYEFHSMETDSDWPLNFGKVCDRRFSAVDEFGKDFGLYIDVFPLDGESDDEREFAKHIRSVRRLERIWSNTVISSRLKVSMGYGVVKKCKILFAKAFHNIIGEERICRLLVNKTSKFDYEQSKMVCSVTDSKMMMEKSWFSDAVRAKFENRTFNIPIGADSVLKQLFGDYMVLPPVEQRVNHGLKVYRKTFHIS